jgi:hypothetical protein
MTLPEVRDAWAFICALEYTFKSATSSVACSCAWHPYLTAVTARRGYLRVRRNAIATGKIATVAECR